MLNSPTYEAQKILFIVIIVEDDTAVGGEAQSVYPIEKERATRGPGYEFCGSRKDPDFKSSVASEPKA